MKRSFRRFALRALMSSLALGLMAAGATETAAFAAGGGTGTAASSGQAGAAHGNPAGSHGRPAGSGSAASGPAGSATSGPASVRAAGAPAQSSPGTVNSANGNKGHIQIEGAADCTTSPCGQDNDPHVAGCTLTVEMFGYPSGTNSADLTISGQAPSGTAKVLTDSFTFIVPATAPPNGSYLDTSRTYTPTASQLAALTPQANQGYHLRIDVAVNGFPAKTHVVWLDCAPTPSSSTSGITGSPGFLRPIGDAPAGPAAPAAVTGSPVYAPDAPVALAGARGDSAAPASSGLAFTGLDVIAVVAGAGVLLVVGVGFVVLSRRAKRVST